MGLGEREFWDCTPRYFAARQRGWNDARTERHDLTRTLAFFSVAPHVKKGTLNSPSDLWALPGDKVAKAAMPVKMATVDESSLALLRKMHQQSGIPIAQTYSEK